MAYAYEAKNARLKGEVEEIQRLAKAEFPTGSQAVAFATPWPSIFGWLGYPIRIKIELLCSDSMLPSPLLRGGPFSLPVLQKRSRNPS